MRMDVNGDGSLTKREMLAADEFTPEEVREGGKGGEGWDWFDTNISVVPTVLQFEGYCLCQSQPVRVQNRKYRIFLYITPIIYRLKLFLTWVMWMGTERLTWMSLLVRI